ncbi:MAG TPA: peptidylprolyl isomerase [Isosphaeraceae bacterium]|nr:peptidylprolyl isomerase [Isosphaeraceae bacterium]
MGLALAALGVLGTEPVHAQRLGKGTAPTKPARPASPDPARAPAADPANTPRLELTAIPVNPTDPIATVNGEVITRQQLADECVARKGEEILETLVARRLIEQALRAKRIEVTAAEVDQEIDNVAMRMAGIGREAWLRTLDKERGISPVQYARDIIYPALALRKLSADRVQVTEKDITSAFEAQYGEKLRCRIIMVDKLRTAQEIWDELRRNPGGFERLAQERSMDSGSRSLGGLLAEPITRHAYPQHVSDAAFAQLVDGDPKDKDPSHKPKDGDFTGPIQVAEATWIIIRREGIIPGQPVNPKDEKIRKLCYEMIYEVKLKEAMSAVFVDLMRAAAIDNKLTGRVKLANEEMVEADGEVQLMGHQKPVKDKPPAPGPAGRGKLPPPVAASPEVIQQAESLQRPPVKK